jgi:Protein of unknown function (DUF3631)
MQAAYLAREEPQAPPYQALDPGGEQRLHQNWLTNNASGVAALRHDANDDLAEVRARSHVLVSQVPASTSALAVGFRSMSNTLVQTAQPVLTGEALLLAQENLLIAALRRPSLSSTMKLTGINERHFPDHLRPAFNIVLTKSQDEIRHLVALGDSRIWPLYGKRIIEWNDARVRTAARQLVDSAWSTEDLDPVSAVQPNNGSKPKPEAKQETPVFESPEERELFEKTLAAIRQIMGGLEEISSKRLTDELIRIEGGPWAEWGAGRRKKPITQNALARLLRPHKVSPVDVGPAHARRKGYKRAQFEHLFRGSPRPSSSAELQPRTRTGGDS